MIEQITRVANDISMHDYGFKRGSIVKLQKSKGTVTELEISTDVLARRKKLYVYMDMGNNNIVRFWWDDPTLKVKIIKP